jgi:hypothetical protein
MSQVRSLPKRRERRPMSEAATRGNLYKINSRELHHPEDADLQITLASCNGKVIRANASRD